MEPSTLFWKPRKMSALLWELGDIKSYADKCKNINKKNLHNFIVKYYANDLNNWNLMNIEHKISVLPFKYSSTEYPIS